MYHTGIVFIFGTRFLFPSPRKNCIPINGEFSNYRFYPLQQMVCLVQQSFFCQ
jgi:hypothetical protein